MPQRCGILIQTGANSTHLVALGLRAYREAILAWQIDMWEFGMIGQWARRFAIGMAAIMVAAGPAGAQVKQVDPSAPYEVPAAPSASAPSGDAAIQSDMTQSDLAGPQDVAGASVASGAETASAAMPAKTYKRDDLIGAAEGVFGKGAKGLAEMLEKILKDQGEPNAYIAGREASGAIGVGFRYGSGTMVHSVEGERPVYWTGPSLGFDLGGDAAKTFVLVYNLYDSQDLYRRYPQVEGRAYFVGGLSATYLRRGDVVIIPIRLGVGVRLGANIGYMKFSEKPRWLPF